jgi:hypothetical protein
MAKVRRVIGSYMALLRMKWARLEILHGFDATPPPDGRQGSSG